MKKNKLIIIFSVLILLFSPINKMEIKAETIIKPSASYLNLVQRIDKNTVKLTWNKSKNAIGYIIYQKENNGSWSKIKTTKKTECILKNLSVDHEYSFKIDAYNSSKGKYKYNTSNIRKYKLSETINFLDAVNAYNASDYYTTYLNYKTFDMGGTAFTNGFTLMGYGKEDIGNVALFNLNGKYTTLTFSLGHVDNEENLNAAVKVFADDVLIDEIYVECEDLPRTVTIPVTGTHKLKFSVYDGASLYAFSTTIGFGNMKISYK